MKHRGIKAHQWSTADFGVVLISLAAPALGGSTQLWAQTLLVAGAGLLMLLDPGRRPLPRPIWLTAAGLAALGLLAFAPASWWGEWPGRAHLTTALQVALPSTWTPQPWVTCEWFALMAASLLWGTYLVSREWRMARTELVRIYLAGLTVLVAAALVLHFRGISVTLWTPLGGPFGFFPNRNQMGNLLGLAGVMSLALLFRELRRKGNARYWWSAAYLILLVAVVVNFSRAGVAIFFGGSMVWMFWANWRNQQRSHAPLLGAAAVMALLMATLFFGGATVERFLAPLASASLESAAPPEEAPGPGRLTIAVDALPLLRDASWHGLGLGGFDPAFARYRHASWGENRAIHPESDWLWWGIELGWFAPLLILFGTGWWLRRHWPKPGRAGYDLSVASALVVILFALHGVVDVSGHRLGSLWPALWLGSLCGQRREDWGAPATKPRWVWRVWGTLLLILAGGWAASLSGRDPWPTSAAFQRARARMAQVNSLDALEEVTQEATAALRYAPLHWQLYFYRAKAALLLGRPLVEVRYDFARAKYLEPNLSSVPFEEGQLWLLRAPKFALGPWREALERAAPATRSAYFDQMLRLTANLPEIRDEVPPLAQGYPELLLAYLRAASRVDFMIEVGRQLLQFPHLESLSAAQRRELFTLWARKGDLNQLMTLIEAHPDWLADAWQGQATALAKSGRFEEACKIVARYCPQPALPDLQPAAGATAYTDRLKRNPADFVAGYALYRLKSREGDEAGALAILHTLTAQKGCPDYFFFLEAEAEARAERWTEAWQAWERFLRAGP